MQCEFCKGLFCLKHKLESDHNCPNIKKLSNEDIIKQKRELVKQKMAAMKKNKGIK